MILTRTYLAVTVPLNELSSLVNWLGPSNVTSNLGKTDAKREKRVSFTAYIIHVYTCTYNVLTKFIHFKVTGGSGQGIVDPATILLNVLDDWQEINVTVNIKGTTSGLNDQKCMRCGCRNREGRLKRLW